jgi:DNA repair photolyase
MQFSINTPYEKDWVKLSPNAAKLPDLLGAIREIHQDGTYISIQVNPILPGIVSKEDLETLMWKLQMAGANHVIFKFVEIVSPAAPSLTERMQKMFPGERSETFARLFSQTIGGLRTVDQEYREDVLSGMKTTTQNLGMTMGLCYEYGKCVGTPGVSLGPRYTTAAQCHGPRVPIFYRENLRGGFRPFEGCPPEGCLYCSTKACGSKLLVQALALKPKDYTTPEVRS